MIYLVNPIGGSGSSGALGGPAKGVIAGEAFLAGCKFADFYAKVTGTRPDDIRIDFVGSGGAFGIHDKKGIDFVKLREAIDLYNNSDKTRSDGSINPEDNKWVLSKGPTGKDGTVIIYVKPKPNTK